MQRPQCTVRESGEISGIGLHSGADSTLRVKPAPAGTGIVFARVDLEGAPRVRADADHLGFRERRTALVGPGGAEIHTVEHFLACCLGLGVDNLLVEIDSSECPGMDGSGRPFADLLTSLGPVEQDAERAEIVLRESIAVPAGEDAVLSAIPAAEGLTASYSLEYDHPFLGRQHYSLRLSSDRFLEEIAPARTFCLASEAEALRNQGLGKGATYQNTLVVGDDGVIENTPRWPDEFARHKILDLLGDLFLLGADLRAHVHAFRTGHAANLRMVRRMLGKDDAPRAAREAPHTPAAISHRQIRRVLPHRYPFLMVDRVLEVEGFQRAVGIKNVTLNEPFFQGHYPEEPIMPGVLIVEAMAQLAGILLLRKLELSGKIPVLLSIDRVKLRKAVVPGDQLRLEAETIRLSGGRGRVRCRATVEDRLVAETRLNFALAKASTA